METLQCKQCGVTPIFNAAFCSRKCYFDNVRGALTLRQANKQLYWVWRAMIRRCTDPKNKSWSDYGARGIAVADEWRESFATFLADMGERPAGGMLERIDNDAGYSPANCRWANATEQSGNRRNCIMVAGVPLKEHCRVNGLPYGTITKRIREGWPVHQAVTKPIRGRA